MEGDFVPLQREPRQGNISRSDMRRASRATVDTEDFGGLMTSDTFYLEDTMIQEGGRETRKSFHDVSKRLSGLLALFDLTGGLPIQQTTDEKK